MPVAMAGGRRRRAYRQKQQEEDRRSGAWLNIPPHLQSRSTTMSVKQEQRSPPTDLGANATRDISAALTGLLADVFALYLKTKNFHWHMRGKHFRDYHLLLDEHADQIFAMSDDIAERARKLGGTTIRSIGDVARRQRLHDNDQESLTAEAMLAELAKDNREFTSYLRAAHEICAKNNDVATTSLIEVWIDQTERRTWFLSEIVGAA
jgi:starvation-inducible DNA-binding protein